MVSSVVPDVRARLAPLCDRDFRRLLAGRGVSVLGDGLYVVAAMWLVFDLTGSSAYTGLAGALTQAPGLFAVVTGPLVDRLSLRRALALAELLQAAFVLVVPVAALFGGLSVTVVLATLPLAALGKLLADPAQQAALPRTLDEEQLVRANSLFSVTRRAVDAVGRAVAGAVVAAAGALAAYGANVLTFLVAAALFATLRLPPRERDPEPLAVERYLREIRAGVDVLRESVLGRMVLASLIASALFGAALAALPAFAARIGGPTTYGLLLAATTAGTVCGSVLAPFVDDRPFGRTTAVGFGIAGACWTAAVLVPGRLPTVAMFAVAQVPIGVYNVGVLATLQAGVPDDLLGRVSSTITTASTAVTPLGMLLGGLAADRVGPATVLLAGGAGTILMAAYYLAVPELRRLGPPSGVSSGQFG
jgi:MFS family permease